MGQSLDYIDQSAFGLRLNIIEGELDKGQFNLLDHGTLTSPDFILEAAVIGASHILTINNAYAVFHEVFACIDVQTDSRRAFYGPLDKVAGRLNLIFGGQIHYEFRSQLCSWTDGESYLNEIENQVRTYKNKADYLALAYEFPHGKLETVPKTIVFAQTKGPEVDINTIHSYPSEKNIVITKTLVNLN
ncbi:MAG: DUF2617 family protein [Nanoarchaeota archaeon]|nr:DUF2617 family protein [Nanoarchaeota archaeon]